MEDVADASNALGRLWSIRGQCDSGDARTHRSVGKGEYLIEGRTKEDEVLVGEPLARPIDGGFGELEQGGDAPVTVVGEAVLVSHGAEKQVEERLRCDEFSEESVADESAIDPAES